MNEEVTAEPQNLYNPISVEISEVVRKIHEETAGFAGSRGIVNEAVNHFKTKNGKLLRPALILFSGKAVKESETKMEDLVLLAAAAELIHSASLIHDDIVDAEILRRGILSLNKKYGPRLAMLVGDLLYSRAFNMLVKNIDRRVIDIITRCVESMCVGEAEEIQEPVSTVSGYFNLIENKTALLMSTCCEIGAITGGGDETSGRALKNYGLYFGMAFQIADDFKDKELFPLGREEDRDYILASAYLYVEKAKKEISILKTSESKESLIELAERILFDVPKELQKLKTGG
ncbi:MAG: hypothetical protein A2452_06590 [Candidatus Firestonebacteria bacterium RIFOXYC2_FULL_39_67]|nr:MAG: hypothetical protein A2452_06590 [Candidatus Firestonebacteria bacterium RIFOXYC2_FULL_39_67]